MAHDGTPDATIQDVIMRLSATHPTQSPCTYYCTADEHAVAIVALRTLTAAEMFTAAQDLCQKRYGVECVRVMPAREYDVLREFKRTQVGYSTDAQCFCALPASIDPRDFTVWLMFCRGIQP